jgi:two-component system sensor histidine kinase KdpD
MVSGREYLLLTDVVTLYVLLIMIVAFRSSRSASITVAALSVAAYDFFFVPPIYRFAMSDGRHILSFALMFTIALTINGLASRIRRQRRVAGLREARARVLYTLTRELAGAPDEEGAAHLAARHAAEAFSGEAAVLLRDNSGSLVLKGGSTPASMEDREMLEVARLTWAHGRPAGPPGTEMQRGVISVPILSAHQAYGILALRSEALDPEQSTFLETFVRQVALAIERVRLANEAKSSALRARTEEMRSALLSAVSHDLRTPLAMITAAGSTLLDRETRLQEGQRMELLESICTEADRMERLIANLLDMMRLESGGLQPRREWVPLEEVVGSAVTHLDAKLQGRKLRLDLPEELPLVSIDPVLFEHVFLNLLDNALKYTPPASALDVRARVRGALVEVEVADEGPGLPAGNAGTVFTKFWRGSHPGVAGIGLGLSICRGIVEAHGGAITAQTRPGGGASFTIVLPHTVGPGAGIPEQLEESCCSP